MKRFTVILLLAVLTLSLFACGKNEKLPEGQPTIRYNDEPLQTLTLLVYRTNGEISVGGNETADEIVGQNASKVEYTEISNGKITLVNGKEENVSYLIAFVGIYDENGELTNYTENALSNLPAGKYIIAAQVSARRAEFSETILYLAGIDKK